MKNKITKTAFLAFLRSNKEKEFDVVDNYSCPFACFYRRQLNTEISTGTRCYVIRGTGEINLLPSWVKDFMSYMFHQRGVTFSGKQVLTMFNKWRKHELSNRKHTRNNRMVAK